MTSRKTVTQHEHWFPVQTIAMAKYQYPFKMLTFCCIRWNNNIITLVSKNIIIP